MVHVPGSKSWRTGNVIKIKGLRWGRVELEWEGLFQTVHPTFKGECRRGWKDFLLEAADGKGREEGGSIYYADPTKEPFILRP